MQGAEFQYITVPQRLVAPEDEAIVLSGDAYPGREIEHLLAKEPSRRYQNAEEVSEDLRGAMRESLPPGDPVAQAIIKDAGKARAQKRFEAGIKSEAAKIAPRTTIPMAPATQGPSPFYQVRIDGEGEAIAPRTTVPMPVATPAPSPAYPRHELPSSQAVQESVEPEQVKQLTEQAWHEFWIEVYPSAQERQD